MTPSYSVIGYAAPVLVLLFRLIQGFALGGEVGPTTAFMAEAAPPHRRGFYLSMQYATQDGAILIAGMVGVTLAHFLSDAQLQEWGWRAAHAARRLHRALRPDAAPLLARDPAQGRRRGAGARCRRPVR